MAYALNIWKEEEEIVRKEKKTTDPDWIHTLEGNPYEGWESTFGCRLPARRGHKRVPYSPYVVNGFRG